MKNSTQNIVILILLFCIIAVAGQRIAVSRQAINAERALRAERLEARREAEVPWVPPQRHISTLVVCDGAPTFISASDGKSPQVLLGAYTLGKLQEYNMAWIEPNCAIAFAVALEASETTTSTATSFLDLSMHALSPFIIYSELSRIGKLGNYGKTLEREMLSDNLSNFLTNQDPVPLHHNYYYTDADLSGDFTPNERIATEGFLPEHLQWDPEIDLNDLFARGADLSLYSDKGGASLKLANITGGPFNGRALYAISLLIQN